MGTNRGILNAAKIAAALIALLAAAVLTAAPEEADAATSAFNEKIRDMKSGTRLYKKGIKKNGGAYNYFRVYKIRKGSKVYKRMNGKSMPKGYDTSGLRYVKVIYRDFKGVKRIGELVVARRVAGKVKKIFYRLFKFGYRIRKMKLVDNYFPKKFTDRQAAARKADDNSMDADNTSAFNYRYVLGTTSLSAHSYGTCIDVNPFENPYCFNRGGRWVAASNQRKSQKYCNRTPSKDRKHMIHGGDFIVKRFRENGFRWLGFGSSMRDYQHFQYAG